MSKFIKPIINYPNRTLDSLYFQVNEQLKLLSLVRAGLNKDLADHVLHCVIHQQKLIIFTESAIWASQLRFYSKSILALLPETQLKPKELDVKVTIMPTNTSKKSTRKAVIPSQAIANEICAQSLSVKDEVLQNALARLGKTLSRLSAFELTKTKT